MEATALPGPLASLFNSDVQPFMRDLMRQNPAQLAQSLTVPLLIVQGDQDIQVAVTDATLLHRAQPKSELRVISDMNHVLKIVPKYDRAANMASYADPALPVAPDAVKAIAEFVRAKR